MGDGFTATEQNSFINAANADTNCTYSLNSVELNNNNLKITYKSKINVTTDPERTFILIKMDKVEFENIEFI